MGTLGVLKGYALGTLGVLKGGVLTGVLQSTHHNDGLPVEQPAVQRGGRARRGVARGELREDQPDALQARA